jgi:undecaprenol kinase
MKDEFVGVRTIKPAIRGEAKQRVVRKNSSGVKLIQIPGWRQGKTWRSANALKTERNLKIHLALAAVVIGCGIGLQIEAMGWAMLSLAVGIVVAAELINTALERVVDLATEGEFHRLARDAKDVAAAAVLCTAIMAAVIGMLVFVPRIIERFFS